MNVCSWTYIVAPFIYWKNHEWHNHAVMSAQPNGFPFAFYPMNRWLQTLEDELNTERRLAMNQRNASDDKPLIKMTRSG